MEDVMKLCLTEYVGELQEKDFKIKLLTNLLGTADAKLYHLNFGGDLEEDLSHFKYSVCLTCAGTIDAWHNRQRASFFPKRKHPLPLGAGPPLLGFE